MRSNVVIIVFGQVVRSQHLLSLVWQTAFAVAVIANMISGIPETLPLMPFTHSLTFILNVAAENTN